MSNKKQQALAAKKAQYYVWYLGWKECRGLGGREFTEPVAKQLIARRRKEELPKLTIEVNKKELKIVQLIENKKGKVDKMKYPPVQSRDVTYAVQSLSPDEDVISCIYLGFNPNTKKAVHVHVYRCDSIETAQMFTEHLNALANLPEHVDRARRIEKELVEKNQIVPRPNSNFFAEDEESLVQYEASLLPPGASGGKDPSPVPNNRPASDIFPMRDKETNGLYGNPGIYRLSSSNTSGTRNSLERDYQVDEETQSQYDSLAEELRRKLGKKPLLLPPKDYDTINRVRGNQFDVQIRHCQNALILGKQDATDDSARGDSETGSQKNSQDSPRSSSGRYSAGYFDTSREIDEADAEIAASMPSISDPTFFQPDRPFSPGPMTKDLHSSYFPGNQTLPGYLPNASNPPEHRTGSKYTAANLGLTHQAHPVSRQRSQDEGYTSLERRQNPSNKDFYDRYAAANGGADYSYQPTNQRRLRRNNEYVEPPIDYTIAIRNNNSRPKYR